MAYVELHCHSAFSFLDGASMPDELVPAAAELGHGALALTDHNALAGSMQFAQTARGLGLRAIHGAELDLGDGRHLTLLVEDARGWRNLCRLVTAAHEGTREGREPGQPAVSIEQIERHAEGLVCLSGCARRGVHDEPGARRLLRAFGPERFRVELQRPFERHDRARNRRLAALAERLGVPCVATGDVHAHCRERALLQDAFVAIRLHRTLDSSEPERRGNHAHVLASPAAMARRFSDHPEAVTESERLAERLRFDLTEDLGYSYPGSEDGSADRRLAELCRARLDGRYGRSARRREAAGRLEEELRVISSLGLAGFFLLHRDLLELAREVAREVRGPDTVRALLPPGRGRGSSVSSIVCYLTGLSHVDPVENGLLLGRFLNEELTALPDIDLDFPRDVRETLIPRVHERYGHERSALVAAYSSYRARGAIREVGKALGLPPSEVERVARSADPWSQEVGESVRAALPERRPEPERAGMPARGEHQGGRWEWLPPLVAEAQGLPRHLSQHPGGMIISTRPLVDLCPIVPAAMEGRQMVQWDKDSCADAGFLKIDLLGLGMLSAVERCVEEIARTRGERIDLSRIDFADRSVYAEIQAARTTGVFQIESRAQMQMLPRTLPESLDDLTVQVALIRPGPIQGGAVHPYIKRRRALRQDPSYRIPYEHPSLEPILRDTLGVIVFQDQVIEVAMAFAGFTAGEAEGLRRAMSRRRSEAALRAYEQRFMEGAERRGATPETAARIFAQILGFSGFGFPKSHSAAFGLLAYQSTWLRVHYGPEFLCALLNEQPMGFYPPDALVHEAQRRGIEVRPPCVQLSAAECQVEGGGAPELDGMDAGMPARAGMPGRGLAVRVGLGYVAEVREREVHALVSERERGGPFDSPADLASRCGASAATLERLAWAGACEQLVPAQEPERRAALWLLGAAATGTALPGGTQLALPLETGPAPALADLGAWERMLADYESTGMTLREHPLELIRPRLEGPLASSADLERLPDGSRVRVAGLAVARQRPSTAKGITFMLLEDEHGTVNVIVPVKVYAVCRAAVRAEPLVLVEGRIERREGVVNLLAGAVHRLADTDVGMSAPARMPGRGRDDTDDPAGPLADVRRLEHPPEGEGEAADLRAVAPAAHSFGRRGR